VKTKEIHEGFIEALLKSMDSQKSEDGIGSERILTPEGGDEWR